MGIGSGACGRVGITQLHLPRARGYWRSSARARLLQTNTVNHDIDAATPARSDEGSVRAAEREFVEGVPKCVRNDLNPGFVGVQRNLEGEGQLKAVRVLCY